jgi:hypothetical protein
MKKLISIKSDESGENIYFTHKNGVDAVRKDDVIDLKIQKKYGFCFGDSINSMVQLILYGIICFIFYQFSDKLYHNLSAYRGNSFDKERYFLYFMNHYVQIFGMLVFFLLGVKQLFFTSSQGKLVIFSKSFKNTLEFSMVNENYGRNAKKLYEHFPSILRNNYEDYFCLKSYQNTKIEHHHPVKFVFLFCIFWGSLIFTILGCVFYFKFDNGAYHWVYFSASNFVIFVFVFAYFTKYSPIIGHSFPIVKNNQVGIILDSPGGNQLFFKTSEIDSFSLRESKYLKLPIIILKTKGDANYEYSIPYGGRGEEFIREFICDEYNELLKSLQYDPEILNAIKNQKN